MSARAPAVLALLLLFGVLPLAGLSLAVVAALGGVVAGGGCAGDGGPGGGTQQIADRVWSAEQTSNAHTVVGRAAAQGLPQRAAVIALSTALRESDLHNRDDRSRGTAGLFGHRPTRSTGGQVLNPATAADGFYRALTAVPDWERLPPGSAAAAVQRATNPAAARDPAQYAPQEPAAAALMQHFWPQPDAPTTPGTESPGTASPGTAPPPLCPDDGASDLLPSGPVDLSALPPDFTLPADPAQRAAVSFALATVGKPYIFGAKGPTAYDCSGLTQAAWAAAGVGVSAGTLSQIHDGIPVAGLADLRPGDLIFIPGSLGTPARPRHVGIYVGHNLLVNAHSRERGVIVERLDAWRSKAVAIRRVAGRGPAAAGTPAAGPLRGFAVLPDAVRTP